MLECHRDAFSDAPDARDLGGVLCDGAIQDHLLLHHLFQEALQSRPASHEASHVPMTHTGQVHHKGDRGCLAHNVTKLPQ